jgi:hypothetical protein
VHLQISSWRFCMKSLTHVTTAVIIVVAGATATQLLPLHLHHHHRCLRSTPPPHCCRWSSRTLIPIQGLVMEGRVLSTVGIAPTGLHRSMIEALSSSHQGEEEGGEEEDDEHRISVVTGLVGAPMIYWMTHISIGPRGRPQGPLKPRTITTPPTSPIPSLIAPGPPPTLPSSEANPSGSETSPDLKSPCSNRLLHQLTHHTAPSSKGRAPGSWDSTAGPSR